VSGASPGQPHVAHGLMGSHVGPCGPLFRFFFVFVGPILFIFR
jgi:hypothetical protein